MEEESGPKSYNFICQVNKSDPELMDMWDIEGLWQSAASLPVRDVPVAEVLAVIDNPHWLSGKPFTNREMAEEAKRVLDADLSYPIIRFPGGEVMDGAHRIAKAWILGHETIKAVRFLEKPPPDLQRTRKELGLDGPVS